MDEMLIEKWAAEAKALNLTPRQYLRGEYTQSDVIASAQSRLARMTNSDLLDAYEREMRNPASVSLSAYRTELLARMSS